jgi:sorting nexin-9/18/33
LSSEIVSQIDESKRYLQDLDAAFKILETVLGEISGKNHTEDCQKLANAYSLLAKALMIDEQRAKTDVILSNSVALTSGVYVQLSLQLGQNLKKLLMEFVASITLFRGVLHSFPKIFQEYQKAQAKRQEYIRLTNESKISHQMLLTVNRRTDVMFYAIIAELNHFRAERDEIMNQAFRDHLDDQIKFCSVIVEDLKKVRAYYD